jgi:guanylate kinase
MSDFSPLLFCLIGPGASGKSSICESLLRMSLPIRLSISSTTRKPRAYEKEGREYYFLSKEEFLDKVKQGFFLEYAEFAGNYYGTSKLNLENAKTEKKHLLLDIEINGVKSLRKQLPENIVNIFICPPSLEVLRERFNKRASDSQDRIEERLRLAKVEIAQSLDANFSDYVVVNNNLEESINQVHAIVVSEQLKRNRIDPDFFSF